MRTQGKPQSVGHATDRELRGGIDAGKRRHRNHSGHRRGVDDVAAFAMRFDAGQEVDQPIDDDAEIDAEHIVPLGVAGNIDRDRC